MIDMGFDDINVSFADEMMTLIERNENFNQILKYQIQFGDWRFLDQLKHDGAGWLKIITNSERMEGMHTTPNTWDKSLSNVRFLRPRPKGHKSV